MEGHLIFVTCNTAVVPSLRIAGRVKKEVPVHFATNVVGIHAFLSKMYDDERIIFFDEMPALVWRSPGGFVKTCIAAQANKRRLSSAFERFKGYTVTTFAISYSYAEFWILKRLARENTVRHYLLINLDAYRKAFSLAARRMEIGFRIVYGLPYTGRRCGGDVVPFIDKSFWRRRGIRSEPWDDRCSGELDVSRLLEGCKRTDARVVLVTQDVVGAKIVTESEYVSAMDALIAGATTSLGEEGICIKPHPLSPQLYGLERRIGARLDSALPFELILDRFRVVIGYSSFCLVQAAKAGKTVISLTSYLKAVSDETATKHTEYLLTQEAGTIFFPRTVAEIIEAVERGIAG